MDQELIDALTQQHIGLDETERRAGPGAARADPGRRLERGGPSDINEITLRAGYRARLVAPLIRGEEIVGLLVVRRRTPGAFPQNTVDLIKTFAAQSAVAIENARLFENVEIVRANWRSRWRICGLRRTAWSRRRSSPRSAN